MAFPEGALRFAEDYQTVGTATKPDNDGGIWIRSGCSGGLFGPFRAKAKQVRDFSGSIGQVLGRLVQTYLV